MSVFEEQLFERIAQSIRTIETELNGVREWYTSDTEEAANAAENVSSEAAHLETLLDKLMRIQESF